MKIYSTNGTTTLFDKVRASRSGYDQGRRTPTPLDSTQGWKTALRNGRTSPIRRMSPWPAPTGLRHAERRGRFALVLALVSVLGVGAEAAPCSPDHSPEPLRLVALYDGVRMPDPRDSALHRLAEAPLNHLGYRLDYLDVASPLPESPLDEDVAGVISWFDRPLADAGTFTEWATGLRTECGRRPQHIILGSPAVPLAGAISPAAARYLALAGLAHDGPERAVTPYARVIGADAAMVGFETGFLPSVGTQASVLATETAVSHLALSPTGRETEPRIDLVVTAATGGYANAAAVVAADPRLGDPLWILNPFSFFETILGTDPRPAPDTTTLTGRRMFFATVQSDGWLSLDPARRLGETGNIAATLLLRDLVARFPDLPVTVAVLQGDLDPSTAGPLAAAGEAAAREIFSQPQVIPATNGHDLVRDWRRLHAASEPSVSTRDEVAGAARGEEAALSYAFRVLGGVFDPHARKPETDDARKYFKAPFDPNREIGGALAATAELAETAQDQPLFLWPAGANPSAQDLDLVEAAGTIGLGGGPVASMPHVPHLSALAPVSAPDHRLVYDALPADAAFSAISALPVGALHGMNQTLTWTEEPRRLAPFHLAFSARSAQRFDTRQAISKALEIARSGDYHVTTASDYVRIATGFQNMRADRTGPKTWRIRDRGALQTVRLDRAEGLAVDLDQSDGVLGARRRGESLYVALDPGVIEPVLRVIEEDAPSGIARGAARPALLDSGVPVRRAAAAGCQTTFVFAPRVGARLTFQIPPGQPLPRASDVAPAPLRMVEEHADGAVTFEIEAAPETDPEIALTFSCEAT